MQAYITTHIHPVITDMKSYVYLRSAHVLLIPKSIVLRRLYNRIASKGVNGLSRSSVTLDISNQPLANTPTSNLDEFLTKIDGKHIKAVFGYGSGVIPQEGYKNLKPQIDIFIVTDNTEDFHRKTLQRFPEHYSGLKYLGIGALQLVQNWGAGVFFNPYVPITSASGNEQMVKYGVISYDRAKEDVCEWSSLYIAGRLQKPVRHYKTDKLLLAANLFNLNSAFNIALLLSLTKEADRSVQLEEFFQCIASLSYMGDPRMLIGGENPNKVKNIVARQQSEFGSLYNPFFMKATRSGLLRQQNETRLKVLLNSLSKAEILSELPLKFRTRLLELYTGEAQSSASPKNAHDELIEVIANDENLSRHILASVRSTIRGPALTQTLKGFATAGIVKSGKYAWEKKLKSWK